MTTVQIQQQMYFGVLIRKYKIDKMGMGLGKKGEKSQLSYLMKYVMTSRCCKGCDDAEEEGDISPELSSKYYHKEV